MTSGQWTFKVQDPIAAEKIGALIQCGETALTRFGATDRPIKRNLAEARKLVDQIERHRDRLEWPLASDDRAEVETELNRVRAEFAALEKFCTRIMENRRRHNREFIGSRISLLAHPSVPEPAKARFAAELVFIGPAAVPAELWAQAVQLRPEMLAGNLSPNFSGAAPHITVKSPPVIMVNSERELFKRAMDYPEFTGAILETWRQHKLSFGQTP